MSGREQELRDLLPRRVWTCFWSENWEDLLPAPSKQLADVVPRTCGGTCAIHTYSEALTAHLRRFAERNDFGVNLPNLIRLAWTKGFLRATGSSVTVIGQHFGQKYGIPVEGTIPDNIADERLHLPDGDSTDSDCFVLGTTVHFFKTKPLPFGALTADKAEDSMKYREHLCGCLDMGPVVLVMELQEHYDVARKEGEPYRRRNYPITPEADRLYHCVTAYGYDCPDGTVRTLRLMYQENMKGAPEEEPQRGLYIDPDAFDRYYLPDVTGMRLSKSPAEGYQTVHLSPPLSPPRSPSPPPPSNMWERIRRALF